MDNNADTKAQLTFQKGEGILLSGARYKLPWLKTNLSHHDPEHRFRLL